MDAAGFALGLALVGVLIWLAFEIRSLHADLQPLINAPIVQTFQRIGT